MIDNAKVLVLTVLVAGALVGAGSAYVGLSYGGMSSAEAGQTMADIVEEQTGTSQEVVNVEEESGMYKVQLNSNNQLQTYYLTKDGKMVSGQMNNLEQIQQTLETQNTVQSCLEDKGAVLYGNASQQATAVQIQALGGASKVSSYYKDVNSPQNLQEAADRGVQSVPTLWLPPEQISSSQNTLTNVRSVEEVSNFANCG